MTGTEKVEQPQMAKTLSIHLYITIPLEQYSL